jgi:hypothetical protein
MQRADPNRRQWIVIPFQRRRVATRGSGASAGSARTGTFVVAAVEQRAGTAARTFHDARAGTAARTFHDARTGTRRDAHARARRNAHARTRNASAPSTWWSSGTDRRAS